MRHLMRAGRNLRVSLGVCVGLCERAESSRWTHGAMLQPALAVIGWRSADGGEVRDVAVSLQPGSRGGLRSYYQAGDLSQIAPTCSMRIRHLPKSPRRMPASPGKPLQPARPEPANCRALPRWWARWGLPLAFTCLRPCQCDAISPSSPHAAILGNPASRAQTSTLPWLPYPSLI